MLSLISKLQRKPEHVRKKIAMVASAVVTGVIIIFWLVSFGSSLAEPTAKPASSEKKEVGPFHALIEGFGGIFTDTAPASQTATGASASAKEANSLPQKEDSMQANEAEVPTP